MFEAICINGSRPRLSASPRKAKCIPVAGNSNKLYENSLTFKFKNATKYRKTVLKIANNFIIITFILLYVVSYLVLFKCGCSKGIKSFIFEEDLKWQMRKSEF